MEKPEAECEDEAVEAEDMVDKENREGETRTQVGCGGILETEIYHCTGQVSVS